MTFHFLVPILLGTFVLHWSGDLGNIETRKGA